MRHVLLCACLLAAAAAKLAAQEANDIKLEPGKLDVRPSFVTASYYFRSLDPPQSEYAAEFRRVGEQEWHRTLATISDQPAGIWKGSVFGLQEDSSWEVRILSGNPDARANPTVVAQQEFRTWSSHPPIAKVIDLSKLPGAEHGIVITDQGTPDGWILYTAPRGWTVRREYSPTDAQLGAIVFQNAQYVILKDVNVGGGDRYGILLDHSESVRILNCEISDWGRVGVQQFTTTVSRGKYMDPKGELINVDGGVTIVRSARTVVERCYIHDPRGRANSWMFSHPSGPEGMFVREAQGGTVVRWNDMIGSDEHRWNDVIESALNSAANGGFCLDSDITGNYLCFGNDDGIELEGGGMNVRFYGNKIEGTTCGVSTGSCRLGPQIIFGNLLANPGDESGLSLMFFKNSYGPPNSGRRYFINNTAYGRDCSAYGSYGGPPWPTQRGFMRNNIFLSSNSRPPADWARSENFDNDLFWIKDSEDLSQKFVASFRGVGQEEHAIMADPKVVNADQADFHLAADSIARGKAAGVSDICPAGADLGAFFGPFDELPYRPLALVAQPRQLKFTAPDQTSAMTVKLTLPAGEKQAVAFQIRQNRVFDWFKVEPAAGELKPGDSLTLTVTADRAKLVGRPLFKGAFLVRTPEGLSRPVTVYAQGTFKENLRPPEAPDSVYLNVADLATLKDLLKPTELPNVAGGQYVSLGALTGKDTLDFRFNIAKAGPYVVLGRAGNAANATMRGSLDFLLDEAAKPWTIQLNGGYNWNAGAPEKFRVVYLCALGDLAAGEHRLRLVPTRSGLDLNELIVTDNPAVFFCEYWQRERK